MHLDPVLLIGGSGLVGRHTAHSLREQTPEIPLLIGGRDQARAREFAGKIGNAEGVEIDLSSDNLGLGDRPVSAVVILVKDDSVSSLRFAQRRAVPHVSISSGLAELGPDVAAYIHRPDAIPIVLGAEWLVGATTVPTLHYARQFAHVDKIVVGAVLDEKDTGGPAASADMQRLTETMPQSLARRNGTFYWRLGDETNAEIRTADGSLLPATALSPFDVIGLAAATDASDIQFNVATRASGSGHGTSMPAEIVVELAGRDHQGQPLRHRHAVKHPQGQMPLTGLGVAMSIERLLGLDGKPAPKPGLYFPYQLMETEAYFSRIDKTGGSIVTL